jgi:hypothetical protein
MASTTPLPLAFWFALPVYIAIGVILWRESPWIRDTALSNSTNAVNFSSARTT